MRRHILDNPLSYYTIFHLARYLPVRICHWIGKIVVLAVYAFSRNDRKGLSFNLSIALNRSKDDPVIRKTVRQIFLNYGQYMADFFLIPQRPSHKVKTFFSTIEGEDILQKALANGRGAILLMAHLGNWEIGGSMLRAMNYPIAVVAMAHNTTATNILVDRLRYDKGIKIFHVDRSLFSSIDILHYLRNNGIVAISGDKDFFNNGRPVTYFGKTVSFPLGPVVMAMNSGADLIPAFVLKQPDGKYFGVLEEAIPLDLEGDRYEVIDKNLAKTARVFEKYIRAYPDQWYCPDPITDSQRPPA
jgi:KDO2-lipid IV(A) lauroyltransferase